MGAQLWHNCRRGADLLRLTWGHTYAQGSSQLLRASWLASSGQGLPCSILITADVLKNDKRHRPLPIVVHAQARPGVAHCAIDCLRKLLDTKRTLGEPVSDPIFGSYKTVHPPRPALNFPGFANRFKTLLAAFPDATSTPPTVHGVRRRHMQFEDAHGSTLRNILQLASIQTEALGHVYLDVSRHLP